MRLAGHGQIETSDAGRWARERERIRDLVDAQCWSDAKRAFVMHSGSERRRDQTVAQMDAMLDACGGNLGVLGEQFDRATGAMLGNTPQALSHLALIHGGSATGEAAATRG